MSNFFMMEQRRRMADLAERRRRRIVEEKAEAMFDKTAARPWFRFYANACAIVVTALIVWGYLDAIGWL